MTNLEIFNQYVEKLGYDSVMNSWEDGTGFIAIFEGNIFLDPLDFTQVTTVEVFSKKHRAVRLSKLDLHNEEIIKGRVKFI